MLVKDLYDYLSTIEENLDITIMDMCVYNEILLQDDKLILSTDFDAVGSEPSLDPYILRVQDFRSYLDGHREAFDYEVYCTKYPVSLKESKETVLALDMYTKDSVNLVAPEELDENGMPRSLSEKKKGFFARLFSKR